MALPNNPKRPYYQRHVSAVLKLRSPGAQRGKKTSLPENLANLPIEELDLSVRSHNALKGARVWTIGELLVLSDAQMLEFRNFGSKSLADVHRALTEFLAVHEAERLDPLAAQGEQVTDEPYNANETLSSGGWKLPQHLGLRRYGLLKVTIDDVLAAPVEVLDLSTRPLGVLTRLGVRCIGDLLIYPRERLSRTENIGRRSLNEIGSKLLAYLSAGEVGNEGESHEQVPKPPLKTKAFVDHILSLLSERQRNVIADRYGLWDGIAETLQDIGGKLGVSRERIRQIEEKGLQRLRRVFGHGVIKDYVLAKIREYLTRGGPESFSVLSEDEIANAFADDCSSEEATLGLSLLRDVNVGLFTSQLVEAEPGVYSIDLGIAREYAALLKLIERSLEECDEPLSEQQIAHKIADGPGVPKREHQSLVKRLLEVSPSLVRLPNDTVALAKWKGFNRRNASSVAEATLLRLAKPAHFREITKKSHTLFPEAGELNERTIHNAIIQTPKTFVWVKNGTYGLSAWGIKKPPFIKDRLIELLSTTQYPLPYWHLRDKVLEVCNCKEPSVRMTLDLNPRLFKKFEGDQYGLQRHYQSLANGSAN